jgi:hypothetical protein
MKPEIHNIAWVDLGFEPQCPSDPAFPEGVDLDISAGSVICCFVPLPYPAKRCGRYHIDCSACRLSVIVTTAGRADDPRSIRLPCQLFHEN